MKRLILLALISLVVAAPAHAQFFKKGLFRKRVEQADSIPGMRSIYEVFNLVHSQYVTDPNTQKLSEEAIRSTLRSLDPHSIYIPAREVGRTNEALQGNFVGVGISYLVINDTVCVQEVIAGGPAEKVGMLPGDRFLRVDGDRATGDSATQGFVFRHLRGKRGTSVVADILRGRDTLSFSIKRDNIPIHSVEVFFMEDDSIGYINLLRFAATSVNEFRNALNALKAQGMKSLILDLRGNGGGFLEVAYGMANEFISPGRLIVYQEGRARKRQDFKSTRRGSFRDGALVVLIDENSASASEIVSGAVQDWDRGVIIGRRSFGKGLVQTQFKLSDGSQVRVTTARYYTPSGRCIQKPYNAGKEAYEKDLINRYKHGEMFSPDSIHFPDSLKYKTAGGRNVYGGGGIMPDIFVPLDTTPSTKFYVECRSKGLINQFPQVWADNHRTDTLVADFDTYLLNFDSLNIFQSFIDYAASKGIVRDSIQETCTDSIRALDYNFLAMQIKGLVADRLFGRGHYYRIMKERDQCYKVAVATLRKPLKLPSRP